ncbi:hypothetical protein LOC67_09135 [Stieleria sp. JC731]|uniref:hypothetical protein n=1 Tax=Pirellulaceae TaxID=2691357 RepID=UPI001E3E2EE1|nr:hypothetical protein [Stieleria sp. JC731]MCC9600726.1 hypothetical protein [Stieleria sp. JC731]
MPTRILDKNGQAIDEDTAWCRLVVELNCPATVEFAVAGASPEDVAKVACGTTALAVARETEIDFGTVYGIGMRCGLRGSDFAFWNSRPLDHRPEKSVVFQQSENEQSTAFLGRVFCDAIQVPVDQDFFHEHLSPLSCIIRPCDLSHRELFAQLTGFLNKSTSRVIGWNHFYRAEGAQLTNFMDWIALPATEQYPNIAEFSDGVVTGWQANPQVPEMLQGPYWMATNVRRYIRSGDENDFPELMYVLKGSYEPAGDDFRNLIPGCYRMGQRLFACLRVEISFFRQDQVNAIGAARSPVEVSAYFAPLENVHFSYPSLSEAELRLPFSLGGWNEDGSLLQIQPGDDNSWVLGHEGTEHVDSEGHLLAELHTPFPPDDERAGLYVTPRTQMKYRVRISNGSVPEIHGGPTRKFEQLENRDVTLNATTATVNCDSAKTELSEQHGLDISATKAKVHASSKMEVKSNLDVSENATVQGEELKLHGNLKIASN